jgi:hypothetical protein
MAVYTTINDPSAYFQTALYNGSASSVTVTNDGNSDLQPDWLWFKKRSATGDHNTFDTSRGLTERLFPNLTSQSDSGDNGITSLTNGFTTGTFYGDVNGSGQTFVTWQWKANGGTTSSNTDGTITSTVQANTTAGFSIITYTGNNTGGSTVGHGLGAVPDMLIAKSRIATKPWQCYHKSIGNDHFIDLNSTNAKVSASAAWGNTTPTSSIVTLGNGDTNHTGAMVMYCFTSIKGYSKFGSYTGNGNADGPFVYTGFSPSWIMTKRTDSTGAWNIQDNKRSPFNVQDNFIQTDSDAEGSAGGTGIWDALSNGFKLRQNLSSTNNSGSNYIYMAFAESPFTTSDGVPTTAR